MWGCWDKRTQTSLLSRVYCALKRAVPATKLYLINVAFALEQVNEIVSIVSIEAKVSEQYLRVLCNVVLNFNTGGDILKCFHLNKSGYQAIL